MTEARYPYGYAKDSNGVMGMGTMLTMGQYVTMTTVKNMHPEVWRRFKALMEFAHVQGVPLGVGTAWRIQPNPPPPGFAQPGNSWHESCPVSPTSSSSLAIDTIPEPSWGWMEANLAPYGLRSFRKPSSWGYSGGAEPWHVQPVEVPASRSYATTLPPLTTWPLPGARPIPPGGGGAEGEDDMPLSDEDIDKVAEAVWAKVIDTTGADAPDPQPARYLLQRSFLMCRQYLGAFNNKPAKDPTMLKQIFDNTK